MNTHTCPAQRCTAAVPNNQLACKQHWVKLPWRLRTNITQAWRNRVNDVGAHAEAVAEAYEWYATHDVDAAPESRGGYTSTTLDAGFSSSGRGE